MLFILQVLVAVAAVFGVVLYRMSVLASVSLVEDKQWSANYAMFIIPATAAMINLVFIIILNFVCNNDNIICDSYQKPECKFKMIFSRFMTKLLFFLQNWNF